MARNRVQRQVAASSAQASAKQKRNQMITGGLATVALVIVAIAIIVGVTSSGSTSGERAPRFLILAIPGWL